MGVGYYDQNVILLFAHGAVGFLGFAHPLNDIFFYKKKGIKVFWVAIYFLEG